MKKIRFKDYCLQFFAQLWKDVRHKPLESISVFVSMVMSFISFLVLLQNCQIAKNSNELAEELSEKQLQQAKVLSDADDVLKKRLNEIYC